MSDSSGPRVLFVSNVYPPEVAPLANRLSNHAKYWLAEGAAVEVMAPNPNYPEGKFYPGYRNRFRRQEIDGVTVTRVPTFVAPNKGTLPRIASYVAFMLSCIWYSRRVRRRPDVVAASSPQFFSAIAGYVISRLKRVPYVLEIRDLWPASIVAVGAMTRNWAIRMLERVERFLYRKADHIVVVTDSFKETIEASGVPADKISVLKNSADLDLFTTELDPKRLEKLRREHGLEGRFVVSYIGTIGMAHGTEVMLRAAELSRDPDTVYVVIGAGAQREQLAARSAELGLPNFRLLPKQERELVPYFMSLTDISVVHLIAAPLFRTVIPSKIFDAMAMRTPLIVGVEGETRKIIEMSGAGVVVPPERPEEIVRAVDALRADPDRRQEMGRRGYAYVVANHDRRQVAARYLALLRRIASLHRSPSTVKC